MADEVDFLGSFCVGEVDCQDEIRCVYVTVCHPLSVMDRFIPSSSISFPHEA